MLKEKVLVFPANLINKQTFSDHGGIIANPAEVNYIRNTILKSGQLSFMDRKLAEEDEGFLQLIPYILLANSDGSYFSYARTTKGGESRLHSKYSVGLGGHINPVDSTNLSEPNDTSLLNCVVRELREEIGIKLNLDFSLQNVALIFCDATPVDRVHFGLAVVLRLDTSDESIKLEDALAKGEFVPWKHLKYYENLENWSKLLVDKVLSQYHETPDCSGCVDELSCK